MSGKSIKIRKLAYFIKEITNSSSRIEVVEPREWEKDPINFIGDPTKCKKLLDLEFKTSIKEGLQLTYNRYRLYINQPYWKYLLDYSISQLYI